MIVTAPGSAVREACWVLGAHRLSPFSHYTRLTAARILSLRLDLVQRMVYLNSNDRIRMFAEIDMEIADLSHQLRQLYTRRNQLTTLCRMPSEILVSIMRYLQFRTDSATYSPFAFDDRVRYDKKWQRIMGTCTHVRDIAMSTQRLWSVITYDRSISPHWLPLCISRCGDTPLELFAHDIPGSTDLCTRFIGEYAHRCDALDIFVRRHIEGAKGALETMGQEQPLLRHLRLEMGNYSRFILSSSFLGGLCSSLRSLSLKHINGVRDPPRFHSLTWLELETRWMETNSDLKEFLRLLDGTPRVRELHVGRFMDMRSCVNVDISPPVDPTPPVLPDLETLRICELPECVDALLQVLPVPARGLHLEPKYCPPDYNIELPSSLPYFVRTLEYAFAFWTRKTGQPDYPDATATFEGGRSSTIMFRGENSVSLSLQFRYWAKRYTPIMDRVTTLQILDSPEPPNEGTGDGHMYNLMRIVVNMHHPSMNLPGIFEWLQARAMMHGPMPYLEFRHGAQNPTKREEADAFAERCRTSSVASDITVVSG